MEKLLEGKPLETWLKAKRIMDPAKLPPQFTQAGADARAELEAEEAAQLLEAMAQKKNHAKTQAAEAQRMPQQEQQKPQGEGQPQKQPQKQEQPQEQPKPQGQPKQQPQNQDQPQKQPQQQEQPQEQPQKQDQPKQQPQKQEQPQKQPEQPGSPRKLALEIVQEQREQIRQAQELVQQHVQKERQLQQEVKDLQEQLQRRPLPGGRIHSPLPLKSISEPEQPSSPVPRRAKLPAISGCKRIGKLPTLPILPRLPPTELSKEVPPQATPLPGLHEPRVPLGGNTGECRPEKIGPLIVHAEQPGEEAHHSLHGVEPVELAPGCIVYVKNGTDLSPAELAAYQVRCRLQGFQGLCRI